MSKNSSLIEIKSESGIIVDLKYYGKYKNAINKCYVRKEVYERLLKAKGYLPKGITFKIWDAYRPMELQKELYYSYKDKIITEFKLQDLSIDEQNKIINKYVALPNNCPAHTTGGAIDLTLVYSDTLEELDMGVNFDSFCSLAHTMFYEKDNMDVNIRNNRRILYGAMTKAGFTNLDSEYWHYDYGNNNWALKTNNNAIYESIDLNDIEKKLRYT